MEFRKIIPTEMDDLKRLQIAYKQEIKETAPKDEDFERLLYAMEDGKILFYGCVHEGRVIACCSVSPSFSTYDYQTGGVFEDFYIVPEYRHKGIAKQLVRYAYEQSNVSSLTVGCADCDVGMYRALGFGIPLGNMLAFDR